MNKFIQDFLTRNFWSILMIFGTMIIFYANTNSRLGQIEVKASEAKEEASNLRVLVERVIVLEEHDKGVTEDLSEIKGEVREVKQLLLQHIQNRN